MSLQLHASAMHGLRFKNLHVSVIKKRMLYQHRHALLSLHIFQLHMRMHMLLHAHAFTHAPNIQYQKKYKWKKN